MSILNQSNPTNPTPCMISGKLKAQARNTYYNLVRLFNESSKDFWANPNASPQQIAECLGKDGAELFKLHGLIGQMLTQIDPNAINEGTSVIGNFSYNDDGSINIV